MRVDRANLQCSKIQDSTSEHPIVISACGIGPDGVENVVEKWDLYTYETEVLPFTCPVDYFSGGTQKYYFLIQIPYSKMFFF